ncbi:MAG: glutamyl-tRNA amidotransferase [Flavobacteriaceae bacterium]|nr:glutamyl-tRNA amidotransferase [Flavobacteriaceae bacterium]OUX39748.1 MAG: glutamyl-tRNA amidotransferase [Flavobacteriaceae bacterium TMED265]
MGLQQKVMEDMKAAMRAKDAVALEALRAIKSAILLAQTESSSKELSEKDELKILQKLVKQRRDSAQIFNEQNRSDLAEPEINQAKIIEKFLPEQLSEQEIANIVKQIITDTGAASMSDMGKVMGVANAKLAGRADGKTISTIVKRELSS